MKTRQELVKAIEKRYQKARRQKKTSILDEFCETTPIWRYNKGPPIRRVFAFLATCARWESYGLSARRDSGEKAPWRAP